MGRSCCEKSVPSRSFKKDLQITFDKLVVAPHCQVFIATPKKSLHLCVCSRVSLSCLKSNLELVLVDTDPICS